MINVVNMLDDNYTDRNEKNEVANAVDQYIKFEHFDFDSNNGILVKVKREGDKTKLSNEQLRNLSNVIKSVTNNKVLILSEIINLTNISKEDADKIEDILSKYNK